MNSITVAGIIGKDAEVRHTPGGDAVCNFTIADSQGKDKEPIWWNCALFGKRADSLSKYLVKGTLLTVAGILTNNKYTDKNGVERVGFNLRVNEVALQGGKRDSEQKQEKPKSSKGFDDMDDDIPF